jgi:DNA-binding NarL/FixJ family response regulator
METYTGTLIDRPLIRVVIVDDYDGIRAAVRKILEREGDIVVVGEAGNGPQAIHLAGEQRPDILLLDVEMPGMGGEEVVRQLRETQPEVRVLALSAHDDLPYVRAMMDNGADAYISKDEAPDLLPYAVRSIVHGGDRWLSPLVAKVAG